MTNEKELTHIDLFSGIGGFTLAGEWTGFRTIVFCEKEEFCQKVLQKRFGAVIADTEYLRKLQSARSKQNKRGWIGDRPVLIPEIRDFDGTKWRGATLLTGGFPCQPFSVAGKKKGKEDDRYLWPEMLRVIKEARPRWILAENVTGIIKLALGQVLSDLESIGYDFPRDHEGTPIVPVIPACGLNAPHRRYRVWIIANSRCGKQGQCGQSNKMSSYRDGKKRTADSPSRPNSHASDSQCLGRQEGSRDRIEHEKQVSKGQDIGNGDSEGINSNSGNQRLQGGKCSKAFQGRQKKPHGSITECDRSSAWQEDWYEVATRFCGVAHGISDRIHRLKALGNAIVPQIAYEILKNIAWIENNRVA